MKPLVACLCLLVAAQTALPCLNESGTKFDGTKGGESYSSAAFELQEPPLSLEPRGVKMEAALRGATEFGKRSDYAIALLYLGRNKEAVTLLETLEKEKSGEYFIAANLGTAYELSGDNEQALHWIGEGIRRNPASHLGTEWLHVKILEAKILHEKDPDYFKKHSVLNLRPESLAQQTNVVIGDQHFTFEALNKALHYQLTERLQFVKPPDPSVASLLFDYAAVEAVKNSLESATDLLKMALDFGYPPDQVQPLLNNYKERIATRNAEARVKATESTRRSPWFVPMLIIVSAIVLSVIAWRVRLSVLKRP